MQLTRILAIRHGETAWNRDTRIQGHTDIALSDKGRWQAERLAQALRDEAIAAFYASDLSRAFDTASTTARAHGKPVHTHKGLRERAFGRFEGLHLGQTRLHAQVSLPGAEAAAAHGVVHVVAGFFHQGQGQGDEAAHQHCV